jgi:hypothetical protein
MSAFFFTQADQSVGFVLSTRATQPPLLPYRAVYVTGNQADSKAYTCDALVTSNGNANVRGFISVTDGSVRAFNSTVHALPTEQVSLQVGSALQITLDEFAESGSMLVVQNATGGTFGFPGDPIQTYDPALKVITLEPGEQGEIVWAMCISSFQARAGNF